MRHRPLAALLAGLAFVAGCGSDGEPSGNGAQDAAGASTSTTAAPSTSATTAAPPAYRLESVDAGDVSCYLTVRDDAGREEQLQASFELCPGGNADASPLVGRRVSLERRPEKVMADSCAGDPACPDTKTVDLVVAVKAAPEPAGAAAPLTGQTDTDPSHWAPSGSEAPQRIQQRIFGEDPPTLVAGFPVTMNGCNLRQLRVKWRSVDGPVTAGIADYADATTPPPDVRRLQPPALQGAMTLNGCEQPAFRAPTQPSGANLANVVVEVTVYEPAA